jgi:hypothetical protein
MKPNKILFIPLDGSKPRMVDDMPQEEIDRNKAKVMADIRRRQEERLMNRPTKIDWKRIEEFVGYGNIEAPVVFIGVEEGLARPEALRQDLLWRSSFKRIMDVKRAHEGLADGPSLFSEKARSQPTWRVMADLMLRYDGHRFSDPKKRRDERARYRKIALGHGSGDALLLELLPYPCKKRGEWLYGDRFPTKEDYVAAILPKRLALLSDVLATHPRTAIICYGRSEWPTFKRLFPANTKWRMIEGRYDTVESATWRRAKITLTYHFSRYFNTDAQLDELSAVTLPRRRKATARQ